MNKRIRKKKGLSKITNQELYSLNITLAKFILPRLIKFKELTDCYPNELNSIDEWHNILDQIIWSFDKHIQDDLSPNITNSEIEQYNNGMMLFAKYFADLWI